MGLTANLGKLPPGFPPYNMNDDVNESRKGDRFYAAEPIHGSFNGADVSVMNASARAVGLQNLYQTTNHVRFLLGHQIHSAGMGSELIYKKIVYNELNDAP